MPHNVNANWHTEETGQVYTVTVSTPSSRVLAVVNVEVPLQPGHRLADRVGEEKVREIEEQARGIARAVADGVQPRPA